MPAAKKDIGMYVESEDYDESKDHDTLNDFEHFFKLPVDLGLFGFGLANAGVAFSSVGPATWAVFLGLLVGKTGRHFWILIPGSFARVQASRRHGFQMFVCGWGGSRSRIDGWPCLWQAWPLRNQVSRGLPKWGRC